jgi:hypothetical protein
MWYNTFTSIKILTLTYNEGKGGIVMNCTACNKTLSRKEAMFTKDREPYCPNPFTCNDMHPNSVKNIVSRGGAVTLYTDEQIELDMLKNLDLTSEMRDRIQKVATKPQSIRLNRQDIAYYLLKLQETHKMASISEAVRYCVNFAMENSPIEEPKKVKHVIVSQPQSEGIKIVIPDIPKSVNVDWNKVELPETPAPGFSEPEEEDEFTF